MASPRRTARYERIPPDGFNMTAPEATLHGKIPPPASLVPLPFQGRQDSNTNITTTGKGNYRRWQAQADSEVRANSAGRFRHGCPRKCTSRRNSLPIRHTPRIFTRLPRQNDKKVQHPLALPAVLCYTIKAIPHKERLATLHAICLQISRHISQKCS